jgi:hypothetical protein
VTSHGIQRGGRHRITGAGHQGLAYLVDSELTGTGAVFAATSPAAATAIAAAAAVTIVVIVLFLRR